MGYALHGLGRAVPAVVRASKRRAGAAVLALLLLVLAADAAAQARERLWNVMCGLPRQDNPILALLPTGGYTGPWQGDPRSGHLEAKTLHRPHPEGGISTDMWLLSRTVGWWRLKAIRAQSTDAWVRAPGRLCAPSSPSGDSPPMGSIDDATFEQLAAP